MPLKHIRPTSKVKQRRLKKKNLKKEYYESIEIISTLKNAGNILIVKLSTMIIYSKMTNTRIYM